MISRVPTPFHDSEETTMTTTDTTFPLGGSFVSGLRERDELGTFTGVQQRSVGTYTGAGLGRRLGRFVDTQFRRIGTSTASIRTATGSMRTATGSFRTA
jgi:hypothetical protein